MTRQTDWQQRLDDYIADNMAVPFDWQTHNCTTFAAGWVREATGCTNTVPESASARQALRAVQAHGGLHANACKWLGEPVPGAFARCGDVVLLHVPRSRNRTSKAFGVCVGAVVAAQGPGGLVMVPITETEAAWRV